MYRIDGENAGGVLPAPTANGPNPGGFWQEGDPDNGIPATKVPAEWMNMIQEEIANVIEDNDGGNTALSKASRTQLKEAIRSMLPGLPKKYVGGPAPQWISNSTIRIPAGAQYRDTTDAADIIVPSNLDVVLSASGALGLDTGSEANSTWYYLWLFKGSSGTTACFSASKTSPTPPTGYTTYKRRVRGAFRNDGSGNLLQIHYITHTLRAEAQYMVPFTNFVNTGPTRSSAGPTNILSAGSATSDTTIAATANYVPPISRFVKLHYSLSQSYARVYEPGTSNYVGISNAGSSDANYNDGVTGWLKTDSSQQIGYALPVTSGNASFDVDSFIDSEED